MMNHPLFNVEKIREDFPILKQQIRGQSLVYLDNAATTQKPRQVIESITNYYSLTNSNVHRGVHTLSQQATQLYEDSRDTVKDFINARLREEIIFVRGTTEAINLVAQSYGKQHIKAGDEILISTMEHHSNIIPWQLLCEQTGAKLKVIPIHQNGELNMDAYEKLLTPKVKLVAIVHLSNSLGTLNDVKKMAELAHDNGAVILVDGAQSAAHITIDVQDMNCDFFTLSGHKLFAPTGIGALYGKKEILETLPPYHGGGDMILSVSFDKTIYNDLPYRFEAGTPNISGAIAQAEAIKYVQHIGLNAIRIYENELLEYGTQLLDAIPEIKIYGRAEEKGSVLSFTVDGIHPHDLGTLLDDDGVAVRTGHHCTQPLMEFYNIPATTRASMVFYNTKSELDRLAQALKKAIKVFS